jgi:hypothetical protein
MEFTVPKVELEGDVNGIMARSGHIIGVSRTRVVWRFGFMPHSDNALAHGAAVDKFLWVIATPSGRTLATFEGFYHELPDRFRKICKSKL